MYIFNDNNNDNDNDNDSDNDNDNDNDNENDNKKTVSARGTMGRGKTWELLFTLPIVPRALSLPSP